MSRMLFSDSDKIVVAFAIGAAFASVLLFFKPSAAVIIAVIALVEIIFIIGREFVRSRFRVGL